MNLKIVLNQQKSNVILSVHDNFSQKLLKAFAPLAANIPIILQDQTFEFIYKCTLKKSVEAQHAPLQLKRHTKVKPR